MIGQDAISLTIMNRRIHHLKRGTLNITRIDRNTIIRAVNIRVLEDIIIGRLINAYTLPLSRNIVVWQIVHSKKAYQLAERLSDQLEDTYAGTDSESIKTFAPRAITIAYWKAMILYIMAGQKWSKDIENYVEWSLKRDLWTKLHFFGKKLEEDIDAENNLETYHPKNILEILPASFSRSQ